MFNRQNVYSHISNVSKKQIDLCLLDFFVNTIVFLFQTNPDQEHLEEKRFILSPIRLIAYKTILFTIHFHSILLVGHRSWDI